MSIFGHKIVKRGIEAMPSQALRNIMDASWEPGTTFWYNPETGARCLVGQAVLATKQYDLSIAERGKLFADDAELLPMRVEVAFDVLCGEKSPAGAKRYCQKIARQELQRRGEWDDGRNDRSRRGGTKYGTLRATLTRFFDIVRGRRQSANRATDRDSESVSALGRGLPAEGTDASDARRGNSREHVLRDPARR